MPSPLLCPPATPPAEGLGPAGTGPLGPTPAGRFLAREECAALVRRAEALAVGGGHTTLFVASHWEANVRWARNQVISSGDIRRNLVTVTRDIRGAVGDAVTNQLDDVGLTTALRHAERFLAFQREQPEADRTALFLEPYPEPKIWSDAMYHQSAEARAELMRRLVAPAARAGLRSAGYVQVSAYGRASLAGDTLWYYPYTLAQCSVTVRTPDGSGSGWAGVDHTDWGKIDAEAIAATALEKCQRSRNPVRLEPGRYTAILEPQAVAELCRFLFGVQLDRAWAESDVVLTPFGKGKGQSKLGERVIDERLTVGLDPMDPAAAFPPFHEWQVFHPATWVTDGVLTDLSYDRSYAVSKLERNTGGLVSSGAFTMTGRGAPTSVEEMIATTTRGVLVTRFSNVANIDYPTGLVTGYTRDGLWLVENGKLAKAVKNFRFTDSPVFALNNVEQIGAPTRVFHPVGSLISDAGESLLNGGQPGYAPIVVPALKVRDFNFTALTDAI